MLRKILLSSAALAGLTTASFAADLPSRKAPAAAPYVAMPIFTWTGFYVGADIGGGWANDAARNTTPVPNLRFPYNGSGVVGGLYAGYNYQLSNAIVLGVEADIDATSINGSINPTDVTNNVKDNIPWQGSLRGRLGYAINNVLLYATGGLAFGGLQMNYSDTAAPFNATTNTTQAGWTVGGGLDYAFNTNWIGRVEYRYTKFSAYNDVFGAGAGVFTGQTIRHSVSENAVKVGIAYKFGAPASAVVAKY